MVEAEEVLPVTGLTEQSDTEIIANDPGAMEEPGAKATKKKGLKTGAFGGATKKRLVQNLLSPRKSKMSKAPVKNGEKGYLWACGHYGWFVLGVLVWIGCRRVIVSCSAVV
ncbi:BnaA10g06330D [Brassica napus]|uniref:(rape) hypothetical protein n=1 Tax=Brassica napus TaxID=3708 RepID=A0A078IKR7_BRANA|nr:unnamed protein product [Brassica napus]CDY50492.1 BnaA10g06330D [Brassica napus]